MNDKHRRFVDEYIIDQNGTRAAIAAGYSEKSARSQASRLLTNANILKAIRERLEDIGKELNITAKDKRQKLWGIAEFCSGQIEGSDGQVKMRDPRAATAAIAELNKMDGEYRNGGEELPHITFIQEFGDTPDFQQELTVTKTEKH